jgi:2-oxoglutarate ferredoxin oxidoreductase subunit beta
VARWTTYHLVDMVKAIKTALGHRGFSFVEIVSQCTTSYAKAVGKKSAADFLAEYKALAVRVDKAQHLTPADLADKIVVGTLRHVVEPEFCDRLRAQIERVSAEAAQE